MEAENEGFVAIKVNGIFISMFSCLLDRHYMKVAQVKYAQKVLSQALLTALTDPAQMLLTGGLRKRTFLPPTLMH